MLLWLFGSFWNLRPYCWHNIYLLAIKCWISPFSSFAPCIPFGRMQSQEQCSIIAFFNSILPYQWNYFLSLKAELCTVESNKWPQFSSSLLPTCNHWLSITFIIFSYDEWVFWIQLSAYGRIYMTASRTFVEACIWLRIHELLHTCVSSLDAHI